MLSLTQTDTGTHAHTYAHTHTHTHTHTIDYSRSLSRSCQVGVIVIEEGKLSFSKAMSGTLPKDLVVQGLVDDGQVVTPLKEWMNFFLGSQNKINK